MRDFGTQSQSLISRFEKQQNIGDASEGHGTLQELSERQQPLSWLQKRSGFVNKSSIVGCVLFIHLLYYYPEALELALGVVVSLVIFSCFVAVVISLLKRSGDSSGEGTNHSRIK
jgi:hypothetical protein